MTFIRLGLVSVLLGAMGCAPVVVIPMPQAVSPDRGSAAIQAWRRRYSVAGTDSANSPRLEMTVGDLLAHQARARLAEKGLDVVAPSVVKLATKDRMPTSPQMAAQITEEAHLDATALYIEVRRWELTPDARGMKPTE
jgi:hypothetical protein